jgi:hydroxyacylglutathione hydrolase
MDNIALKNSVNFEIVQLPAFNDNYIFVLHHTSLRETYVVDPGDAKVVIQLLKERQWSLTGILITHHHPDHMGGVLELIGLTGATTFGPKSELQRIQKFAPLNTALTPGQSIDILGENCQILDLAAHTLGQIGYYFARLNLLFCGDALFSMGCGKLFEGTPTLLFDVLNRLYDLPDETAVYCAHEYTLTNARFAMGLEPNNLSLLKFFSHVETLRAQGQFTIPFFLKTQKELNPFFAPIKSYKNLDALNPANRNNSIAEVGELRRLRDHWK